MMRWAHQNPGVECISLDGGRLRSDGRQLISEPPQSPAELAGVPLDVTPLDCRWKAHSDARNMVATHETALEREAERIAKFAGEVESLDQWLAGAYNQLHGKTEISRLKSAIEEIDQELAELKRDLALR
eukprot:5076077-Prymnesium_polylepis.2